MTRTPKVLLAVLGLLAVCFVLWLQSGVLRRQPQVLSDLPPYGEELRALPEDGSWASLSQGADHPYAGPGDSPVRSPDGSLVAATVSWAEPVSYAVLGLVSDRPFLHTVGVWDEQSGNFKRVLSIMESDPHSGFAHRYAWSRDSRALLIHGRGGLPDDYRRSLYLCLVYLPDTDELFQLTTCRPPEWGYSWSEDAAERGDAPDRALS